MLEITTTRHNPLVDPQLAVWSWEIPVYLFFGGIDRRHDGARPASRCCASRAASDPESFFSRADAAARLRAAERSAWARCSSTSRTSSTSGAST